MNTLHAPRVELNDDVAEQAIVVLKLFISTVEGWKILTDFKLFQITAKTTFVQLESGIQIERCNCTQTLGNT